MRHDQGVLCALHTLLILPLLPSYRRFLVVRVTLEERCPYPFSGAQIVRRFGKVRAVAWRQALDAVP